MYNNHLSFGFSNVRHKGKELVTSFGSDSFEFNYVNINKMPFSVGYIPAGYEHRADLISNLFYNTPTLDWFLCFFNNIKDPFNQLNVGDRILIPNKLV